MAEVDAPNAKPDGQLSKPWVVIAGATFGALTLLFLVFLLSSGSAVRCQDRFLVGAIFSLGTALSVAFLGGSAAANGSIEILKGRALEFTAAGGAALLIIMLGLTTQLYAAAPCFQSPFGECPDITGAWRRPHDALTWTFSSDGCKVTGRLMSNTFDHKFTGEFIKVRGDTRARFEVNRANKTDNCQTRLEGTLWPWPYGDQISGLRVKIFATDGECDLQANYSEDFFYERQQ